MIISTDIEEALDKLNIYSWFPKHSVKKIDGYSI